MIAGTQQNLLLELQQPDIRKPVNELYANYFEGIVAQVCSNGGSRDDGADIFQDAILVLIEKIKTGQFRGESSIKTFLSAIARNLWLFELRTRNRRKKRELIYHNGGHMEMQAHEQFFKRNTTKNLEQVMAQLGDVCKKLLTGFYYHEKSMKELLAEFEYENEQVLRNKKSKCMKKLKELIQADTTLLQTLIPISIYEH